MGKITIIILSFRVGTSKNKNIDHRVKETYAIMSTQVTYEVDYISLLRDLTSRALNFVFLKGHIKRNMNSKKRNVYIGNQYCYYLGLQKISRSVGPVQQKIKLPSPNCS